MEIAKTAIGKLRSVNDPLFQSHAHQAERLDFDAICEAYPERDFTFLDFITDDKCRITCRLWWHVIISYSYRSPLKEFFDCSQMFCVRIRSRVFATVQPCYSPQRSRLNQSSHL